MGYPKLDFLLPGISRIIECLRQVQQGFSSLFCQFFGTFVHFQSGALKLLQKFEKKFEFSKNLAKKTEERPC